MKNHGKYYVGQKIHITTNEFRKYWGQGCVER